jgi:hypothetical protein
VDEAGCRNKSNRKTSSMNHETTKESEKELRVILFIVMQAD